MNPTSPDHSDRLQPPHNPPVVGLIPTDPTPSYFLALPKIWMCHDGYMNDEEEIVLSGGMATKVTRLGGVVFRSPKPQSATVLSFLIYLSGEGYPASPRPIGNGFASDGREMLEFIEGTSPQPFAWSDQAGFEIGDLLRTLHGLSVEWTPPPNAIWRPWFARELTGERLVIGHGDLGPWNILARDGHPVAFIDWDNAGPVDPMWELAHVVWQNAQLYDDDVSDLNHLPGANQRATQAKRILDGYQLDRAMRAGFVDRMIEMAIWSAREEATEYNVESDSESPTSSGYPILWAVTWRARSAAWMLDNRQMLQHVLDS
jgi:hypothetical protein